MRKKPLGLLLATGLIMPQQLWPQLVGAVQSEAPASAMNWQTMTREAIAKFEQTALQEWAFCLASAENEEGELTSTTECFDPSLPADQQWQLHLINGQRPTAELQRNYEEKKQKQAQKGKAFNLTLKLNRLILLDTVEFVSEDASSWTGRFDVSIDQLGGTANKQLQGQLRFNKSGNYIDRIDVHNRGPFSVMLGTQIEHFQLKLAFIKQEHAILQQQQEMTMQGTFAFLTPIDEVSSDVFSNFRYVGAAAQPDH